MPLSELTGFALGHARQLQRLVDEVRRATPGRIVVTGEPGLAAQARLALVAGGEPGLVVLVDEAAVEPELLASSAVLVVALAGADVGPALEAALRVADRASVQVVCVRACADSAGLEPPPYVLATDVVDIRPGGPLPAAALCARVGAAAGARGFAIAGRLPAIRGPVCEALVARHSRFSGAVGAATFVPGADLPAITLNQLRLVARIAAAHGIELDRARLVELGAVVGIGFGLRSLARQALAVVPGPGWALKGAVAYGGTSAIGRAAIARCERIAAGDARPAGETPQRGGRAS